MESIQIRADDELFRKIIDSSYDGIFITDGEGRALYFNQSFLNISALDGQKIIGRTMGELIESGEIPDACSLEVISSGKPVTKVIDYYHGISALVTSTPILENGGKLIRVVSNVRDITELVKLKKQLKNSNNLNAEYQRQLWQIQQEANGKQMMLAKSAIMENLLKIASRAAMVNCSVLIQGESGVGKDMMARYIHDSAEASPDRPFIHINCSAIPEALLESELFGYEPGAFTGAAKSGKAGMFEIANNGTLFLDEIGEMPLSIQVKLLDILQTNHVFRLGGTKTVRINTRIIAATNSDLEALIKEGRFRRDLYYRLNVIPIYIPALRDRKEDIVPLILHFLAVKNHKFGLAKTISSDIVEILARYNWPGNVRELKNIVERMVVMSESDVIDEKAVPLYIKQVANKVYYIDTPDYFESFDLKSVMDQLECEVIKRALTVFGSMRKTAQHLGIDLSTLVRKKKRYHI